MLRPEIELLLELAPMPPQLEAEDEYVKQVDERLDAIQRPVTLEEAKALVKMFGPDDFYNLAWGLLTIIEEAPGWPGDADLSGDGEWPTALRTRLKNAGLY